MELKPGSRWKSPACTAEFIVVRPPKQPGSLQCGGHDVVAAGEASPDGLALSADFADGINVGKRFHDEQSGIELLATKAGKGSLSFDGRKLGLKEAKALPASD
ncbi:MAG: hypothetical protein ACSLE1_16800 [Sphingobium sp.]